MSQQILPNIILPKQQSGPRLRRGKGLESLIEISQLGVVLTKVPSAIRWLPNGRAVPTKAPVDFFGMHTASKRLMIMDAKECHLKTRLDTSIDHFAEHQRQMLIRYGELGAVSGLLVEATAMLQLYWVPWRMLSPRRPSYAWEELTAIGSSQVAITAERWEKLISATDKEST